MRFIYRYPLEINTIGFSVNIEAIANFCKNRIRVLNFFLSLPLDVL